MIFCRHCQGEAIGCPTCEGEGLQRCDNRGCKDTAIGFDEDGNALCENCLSEWACNYGIQKDE